MAFSSLRRDYSKERMRYGKQDSASGTRDCYQPESQSRLPTRAHGITATLSPKRPETGDK
jgi:hypothetical protein